MSPTFAFLLVCVQACLIQNVYSQCFGSQGLGLGYGAIAGPSLAAPGLGLAGSCGLGAGLAGNYGLGAGLGLAGPYGAAGIGGCGGAAYGGAGIGNVAVAGELPVAGTAALAGQVPIIGCVSFEGPVAAAGAVTIAGSCACGCGAPGAYGIY